MNHAKSYVAAFLALVLLGCGGSGGGSDHGTNPDLSTPHIEAIVQVERASLQNPDQFTDAELLDPTNMDVYNDLLPSSKSVFGIQDPLNLQVGEKYVFQLVSYTSTGERVILPATFMTSDPNNTYGQIAENSGSFAASNVATADNQTVFAHYNGEDYQTQFAVRARQARVIGKILEAGSNKPLAGVQLNFYAAGGLYVGTVTTASDGSFRASVPTSAIQFTVVGNTIPASDYRVFTYEGANYEASNADCRAMLPTLSQGPQTLTTVYLSSREGDLPQLNGCSSAQ